MEGRRFQLNAWRNWLPLSSEDQIAWALAAIASSYFFGLTPGHVFVQDDFAAYVMHAVNLVDGHPYTDIHYVPNAQAPWVSPANGYPPVYPLLLAPLYRMLGIDLRAMKVVTIFTFMIFLAAFTMSVRIGSPARPGWSRFYFTQRTERAPSALRCRRPWCSRTLHDSNGRAVF